MTGGASAPRPRGSARSGWWWPALVVAFVVVPIIEVYLLIQTGRAIGVGWTVLVLVAEALFGSWLVKREGLRAWRSLREAIGGGGMPSRQLIDAALVLVGGVLFILPGFFTDVLGLVCLLPFTRPAPRALIARVASSQARKHGFDLSDMNAHRRVTPGDGVIIEGHTAPDSDPTGTRAAGDSGRAVEGRIVN